jgi:hypothetical protein
MPTAIEFPVWEELLRFLHLDFEGFFVRSENPINAKSNKTMEEAIEILRGKLEDLAREN